MAEPDGKQIDVSSTDRWGTRGWEVRYAVIAKRSMSDVSGTALLTDIPARSQSHRLYSDQANKYRQGPERL
jgi:hypothetical protein